MSDINNVDFKKSKTYANLQTAFAGESQARVKQKRMAMSRLLQSLTKVQTMKMRMQRCGTST